MNELKLSPRVGLVCRLPIQDKNALSGTPAKMCEALLKLGVQVVDLSPPLPNYRADSFLTKIMRRFRIWLHRLQKMWLGEYRTAIAAAIKLSRELQTKIDESEVDLVLCICMSTPLYALRNDRPIFYTSDSTARLINTDYPFWAAKSKAYHRACDAIEKTALSRCIYFLPSSDCAVVSAIEHYSMPPERIKRIEFGAHIEADIDIQAPSLPSKNDLQIVLVAADPIRKRLHFCVEVVNALRERAWNAKLNYIGPWHALVESENVNWVGHLQLSEAKDRQKHIETLRVSHWMILPSLAEAYGIAPCEAAHFGRPSIVSDVGGLPTVIKNGRSGLILPLSASVEDYVLALEQASENESQYRALSLNALERARTVLNWDAWAVRVNEVLCAVHTQHLK